MAQPIPTHAAIVIVGGGIIGCAIAYHLTKRGHRDVVLLEKSRITYGSTWHAAGNIGQLRSSRALTKIVTMSVEQFRSLERETGVSPDWREVGSLRIASSEERWRELEGAAAGARGFGFEVELVTPEECKRLYPYISLEGVVGGAFTPSDGYVQPSGVTEAFAKGAREGAARILEGVRVTGFERTGRRILKILTDQGAIRCDLVINAAGMWAREVGAMAGVAVPVAAFENQYLITEPIPDLPRDLPVIRDNDNYFYARPEVGGLLVGTVDKENPPFGRGGIPPDFERQLLPEDLERFEPALGRITRRLPILSELGVRDVVNGPLPMSVDGEPIVGFALDNFFLACGFVAGIGQAGGAGAVIAEWLTEGRPPFDLSALDCRRFSSSAYSEDELYAAAERALAHHYDIHDPDDEPR
ncbi:MAG: FAD-dependent oxidoreductase [Proteobacteria bacterium]|nr:FAD-dependent oxidoreductase [Pseudomonadota bacterium]